MMEKLKKYQVFVYLILIILIMGTVKIKYGENNKITNYELRITNITPTVIPTAVPTAEATPTINPNDDYPLWRLLPYKGEGFTVDKYIAPMTLEMTITTATESAAIKEVTVWLNSFKELKERHKVVIVKNSKP
jgi:hypothetical protein